MYQWEQFRSCWLKWNGLQAPQIACMLPLRYENHQDQNTKAWLPDNQRALWICGCTLWASECSMCFSDIHQWCVARYAKQIWLNTFLFFFISYRTNYYWKVTIHRVLFCVVLGLDEIDIHKYKVLDSFYRGFIWNLSSVAAAVTAHTKRKALAH